MNRLSLLRALILVGLTGALGAASAKSTGDPMSRFERAHPQCQQWTDWRRLCSRTGPKGAVSCRRDLRVSVTPSAPFCVAGAWQEVPWYVADTPAEQKSRLRFCAVKDAEEFGPKKLTICREYRERRPFNGAHLDTVYDDRCQIVRMVSREADVCRNDGSPGVPNCSETLTRFRATKPLYCAQWKPAGCGNLASDTKDSTPSDGVAIAPNRTLTGTAVWGPFCAAPRKGEKR